MKKDEIYHCNLCKASIHGDAAPLFLIGLHWADYPIHGWIKQPVYETEKHICKTCLNSLQIIAKQTFSVMERQS